jgi:hypothetical protein
MLSDGVMASGMRRLDMTEISFRRYTNLAATIHLLRQKAITLLNPATWDDTNDAYYMAEYKRYKNARAVLALCFAESQETYHNWRVFSHGSDGVCIQFDKARFLSTFANDHWIQRGYVKYELIKDLQRENSIDLEKLSFLKRHPYEDEKEFRIIYVDRHDAPEFSDYPIEVDWIKRITLSPWMSKDLAESVKASLKAVKGCSEIKIFRSTLVDNVAWKKLTSRVHPLK